MACMSTLKATMMHELSMGGDETATFVAARGQAFCESIECMPDVYANTLVSICSYQRVREKSQSAIAAFFLFLQTRRVSSSD